MSDYGFSRKTTMTPAAVIAIIAGFLFLSEGSAHAKSGYLTSFNSTYGTSGTALNTCSLCHSGGNTDSLNSFATAYKSAGRSYGSIEAQDSDGDGFDNRTEIDARTFPGNAASKPVVVLPPPPAPPTPPPTTPAPPPATPTLPTPPPAAGDLDSDGDGVPDHEEGYPHDNRKVTVTNPNGGDNVIIDTSLNASTRLMSADCLADSDPLLNQAGKPAGYEFRHGVETFRVAGLVPGGTATVVLSFPETIQADAKVYKVNGLGFHEFPHAAINGNTVTLTLTDGGEGDADGAANGVIDDPVAVATPVAASTPATADAAVGGGGCSVAGTNGSGGFAGSLIFLALAALALRACRRFSGKR